MKLTNSEFMKIAKFLSTAKNAKCGCCVTLHGAFGGESEQKCRQACNFWILKQTTEADFNRLCKLTVGNRYWSMYASMPDLERVLIYDWRKNEFFNAKFEPFIPLLEKEEK